jgi:anti-anti-sigma regulatory factor
VIRITQNRKCAELHLSVEGTLSGVWVNELEKCWLDAKASLNDESIIVDLSGVAYIDDKGRQLLAQMVRDGAQLAATGVMTKGIIEEIVAESAPPDLT